MYFNTKIVVFQLRVLPPMLCVSICSIYLYVSKGIHFVELFTYFGDEVINIPLENTTKL